MAEKYVLEGALPAAIQQLKIAKQEGDGDFYQLSAVEARARQLESLYLEDLKDRGIIKK
jgi:predicted Zn-dependent protease